MGKACSTQGRDEKFIQNFSQKTSALGGCEWSLHGPAALSLKKEPPIPTG
jgi:hypothetical protein